MNAGRVPLAKMLSDLKFRKQAEILRLNTNDIIIIEKHHELHTEIKYRLIEDAQSVIEDVNIQLETL